MQKIDVTKHGMVRAKFERVNTDTNEIEYVETLTFPKKEKIEPIEIILRRRPVKEDD